MKRLLLLLVLPLSGCSNLTPEQNAALFNAGLQAGIRIAERATK